MRWSKAFPVVVVLAAAAVWAGPASSQGTPSDIRVDESKHQRPILPSLRDFGSFGPTIGFMKIFRGDLDAPTKIRPVMGVVFRYRFSDNWIGIGDFGFGWNAFKDRGDTVLTVTIGTLGVARRIATYFDTDLRALVGGGFYRWNYKYHGQSLRDRYPVNLQPNGSPVFGGSQLFYRGMAPGGYLGIEGERRVTRHVTVTGALQDNYVFTSDSKFDRVFDRNYSFISFRLGANYHFSPTEGILWERHKSNTITVESGKEGK